MAGIFEKDSNGILAVLLWYTTVIIGFVICVLVIINSILLPIYRLHDIGVSGWTYLLVLIPLIGFIYYIYIFCAAGDEKDNKYGPQPPKPTIWDYLLIPISIIVICNAGAFGPEHEDKHLGGREHSIGEIHGSQSNSDVKS